MDQEASINVKSLRAKFQEPLAKDRPPVPERPKRLPAAVVHCGSIPAVIRPAITATENKALVCPKTTLSKDHKRTASLPIHPPQSSTSQATGSANPISKAAFKDRHLPLVLPIPFSSEPKHHTVSPPKGVSSPVRGKKKTTMMPFKSTIASKFTKGTLENGGDSGESVSMAKPKADAGFSHNGGSSNPGSVSPSPEKPGPAPAGDVMKGSHKDSGLQASQEHGLSTLERAKRKFSPKQLLEYAKPKSYHSRNSSPCASPPPLPVDYENMNTDKDPSAPQPESALATVPLHAPPSPFRSNGVCLSYATVSRDKGFHFDLSAHAPPVKLLPDLKSLGSKPAKPPRPPLVDLSPFSTFSELEQNGFLSASASAPCEDEHLDHHGLDAPEFPDFDLSELENLDQNAFVLAHVDVPPAVTTVFGDVELPAPDPVDLDGIASSLPFTCEQAASESPEPPALPPLAHSHPAPPLEADAAEEMSSDCLLGSMQATGSFVTSELASEHNVSQMDSFCDHSDNIYEDVAPVAKVHFSQSSRKRKGPPKNPYASPPLNELTRKTIRSLSAWSKDTGEHINLTRKPSFRKERGSPEDQEQKEQKKKEKHLEKEKKEQKERQKRENEMKKKFKVTGLEEPMYQAKVMVASKVRKHDLPVKSGDTVSIIRTNNCPKGKWLARDAAHKYGYVSLKNLELNIKEMLELGKRASQAAGVATGEGDTISLGNRSFTHNPVHTSSFTDDSEEWSFEEETLSPTTDMSQCRSMSMPEMFCGDGDVHHTQTGSAVDDETAQSRREALQKLAVFFQQSRGSCDDAISAEEDTPTNPEKTGFLCAVEEPPYLEPSEEPFDFADVVLLPPPQLYADTC